MTFPKHVTLVEVGPRDGLQSEQQMIPTATKIEFIHRLYETGLKFIEVTSFVSPKWVPQMADHLEVIKGIKRLPNIHYPVIIPNVQGLRKAIGADVEEIAVLTAASETFTQKNTHCSIAGSLQRIREIMTIAKQHQIHVRAYLSTAFVCPYEGIIAPAQVGKIAQQLLNLGCEQISLSDTIGAATAPQVEALLKHLIDINIPIEKLAVHFHDTYGQALTNIYVSLQYGIATIDSAVAGLGGCPYAPGASGNVGTEDVVYLLNSLGIETGVDLEKLIEVGHYICRKLDTIPHSKVSEAYLWRHSNRPNDMCDGNYPW